MGNKKPFLLSSEIIVRVFSDVVILTSSFVLANLLCNLIPVLGASGIDFMSRISGQLLGIFFQSSILMMIGVSVFSLSGFYTKGRAYQGKFKVLLIMQAVSSAYVLFGFTNFFLSDYLAPVSKNSIVLGWFITCGAVTIARLYSQLWRKVLIKEEIAKNSTIDDNRKSVLVIGGAGYIGSVLCRKLLSMGYYVRVLDALFYGKESIDALLKHSRFEFIEGDSRDIESVVRSMKGMKAVVHLGEIVGDPATALDQQLTQEINVAATKMVAMAAKGFGARRFVYASSCSVYGASDEIVDEHSKLNPLSLYARAKIDAERTLLELNAPDFHPAILRFATVFGLSPRPRFDLVVNLLIAKAVQDGKITIHGGNQWRPFIHVNDIAEAIIKALESPLANVKGQIFNVGSDTLNYSILDIGKIINKIIPEAEIVIEEENSDQRNYRVNFDKIHRELGFKSSLTIEDAVKEIRSAFDSGDLISYQSKQFSNYKTLCEESEKSNIRYIFNEFFAPIRINEVR